MLGFSVAAGPASADEPVASFEDLAEVKEVLLDVVALDSKGYPVLGLETDDFIVEENGETVEVTGVSFHASRYGIRDEALEGLEAVPTSRYFILAYHNPIGGGSLGDVVTRRQHRLLQDSQEWVQDFLLPSDWVAVVSYDVHLKVYQDFTQDRQALADAIHQAQLRRNPERQWARGGRPQPPSGAPSLLRHLPSGKELRRSTRRFHDGLRLLAEASGFIVGRKNLILFSSGFGTLDSLQLGGHPELRHYEPMQQALNDHNVAVYTVDLTPFELQRVRSGSLQRLALDTGGGYLRDPTSLLFPLQAISRENVGYYLLSYQSTRPVRGGYQRVEVSTRRDGVRLRARTGYRFGRSD